MSLLKIIRPLFTFSIIYVVAIFSKIPYASFIPYFSSLLFTLFTFYSLIFSKYHDFIINLWILNFEVKEIIYLNLSCTGQVSSLHLYKFYLTIL